MLHSQTVWAHACFRLDIKFPIGSGSLLLGGEADLFELWHSLSYRIIRSPDDLLAHVRRIRLCREPLLQERLSGALLDLEYVLGSRGSLLRDRLRLESAQVLATMPEVTFGASSMSVKGQVLPTVSNLLRTGEAAEYLS